METKYEAESEPANVSSLVSGIIQDSRQLLSQQLLLFQVELKNDVRRTITAAVPMLIGVVICAMSLFMFLHAAAYFLCWLVPDMPYWIGYGIVAGAGALLGLGLALWGANKLRSFNPLPDKSVEGLKENFQWKTKS